MQQVVGTLKGHGATIVAITPQLVEASRSLIEKQGISFDLLSDPGNAYAAKLGLRFHGLLDADRTLTFLQNCASVAPLASIMK